MQTDTESDFSSVFYRYKDGSGSMKDIVEHVEFQLALRRIVPAFNYTVFRGERDGDDICQEISIRLFEEEVNNKLRRFDNVETVEHFFSWLFVFTRSHYYDLVRRRLAQKREGQRSDDPVEEYDFPIFDRISNHILETDEEREAREAREDAAIEGFPEFIEQYPFARQWAIRRWLRNKSYRRIQKMLQRLGCVVTYVTIGNWIKATIKDYAEYLKELPSEQRRTGT